MNKAYLIIALKNETGLTKSEAEAVAPADGTGVAPEDGTGVGPV